ncbi:hypothetical protein EG329_004886 [Mollisiaceae sp. DMI_Dod_QoI]|nr:hypothetical protein EG329_004886 [Helotiales sp. DMI_Dod_QoI]
MSLLFIFTLSILVLPIISTPPPAQVALLSFLDTEENHGPSLENARANAPHIFNAIHSSMRQWGSSLNHNGMSFFPARIPNNTHLYHGTHTLDAVTGMEWLAFEIEHAEMFSQTLPRPRPPPGSLGSPCPSASPGCHPSPMEVDWAESWNEISHTDDDDDDDQESIQGYLHIYRTTRPLNNLLYIDGTSAGKSTLGTLDSQDFVLCNRSNNTQFWADYDRGKELCAIGAEWGIQGFIRMEMGFEVIFCEFSDGLTLESARQRPTWKTRRKYEVLNDFEVVRGASLRYPGITAQRLELDYSGMVSAFWYNLNLTNPDSEHSDVPRLPSSEKEELARMKSDVKKAFEESVAREDVGNDWQGVVDMIVTRYSDRLQVMAGNNSSRENILIGIGILLNVFLDYGNVDVPTAVEKCSTHYLGTTVPETASDHFIQEAVLGVTNKICSTLFYVRELLLEGEETADSSLLDESRVALQELVEYLNWTTWRECGKCAYDEVCLAAIWPWGTVEDHKHPTCLKGDVVRNRFGYWM